MVTPVMMSLMEEPEMINCMVGMAMIIIFLLMEMV